MSDPLHDDRIPSDPDERRARRIRVILGIGIPSALAGGVAWGLGVPLLAVLIFLVVVAVGILSNS